MNLQYQQQVMMIMMSFSMSHLISLFQEPLCASLYVSECNRMHPRTPKATKISWESMLQDPPKVKACMSAMSSTSANHNNHTLKMPTVDICLTHGRNIIGVENCIESCHQWYIIYAHYHMTFVTCACIFARYSWWRWFTVPLAPTITW